MTFKGLVASCHSFYFNYFSISSLLTPRIGPPYGGAGAGIELLAGQQADALLSELSRTLAEQRRTLSELRRNLCATLHPFLIRLRFFLLINYVISIMYATLI